MLTLKLVSIDGWNGSSSRTTTRNVDGEANKGHVKEMMMVNGDGGDDSWNVSGDEG